MVFGQLQRAWTLKDSGDLEQDFPRIQDNFQGRHILPCPSLSIPPGESSRPLGSLNEEIVKFPVFGGNPVQVSTQQGLHL